MPALREALETQGQEAGLGPPSIDSQFPDDSQLREWRKTVGLPESIPFTPITVNRWQVNPDGLAIAAGLAVGAVVFGSDNKTPSGSDANPSDQSSEPLVPRGKMSRRQFLRVVTIGGAGAVLAACMPSSSPQPRPTEGQPGAAPTPTVDINPNLLASLKTDTNFVDNQTWGRRTFGPQMDALARQFSSERVRAMRMNVSGALGEGNKLLGYAFDVFEGTRRYLYFGSDSTGSNGAFVAIPGAATIAFADGVEIGFPINQKQDRFVHKYVDSAGNYLDPRMGMMVGVGSGVTAQSSEINTFLADISEPSSILVRSEVVAKKDDQALFTLKVKYEAKGNQLFGVVEEVNGKGETSIYVVSQKNNEVGVHKLEQIQGYTYLLNKTTGEIELYQNGQLAGRVKSVGSTGQVQVEIPGLATATPKPTDTLTPTATATITLTPTPIATPKPTETLKPKEVTLRDIGQKLGINIGTTVNGAERWQETGYKDASKHFSILFPSGEFLQSSIKRFGLSGAEEFRRRVNKDKQILYIHPGFMPLYDVSESLKTALEGGVKEYMEERVRTLLRFVDKVDTGAKPTYINFLNEAIYYDNGNYGIHKSPYRQAFGDAHMRDNPYLFISEIYLMFYSIAKDMGLEAGKDFRMIYSESDIMSPGGKTDVVIKELLRAKEEIAKRVGILKQNVQLDVAPHFHMFYSNRPSYLRAPPTEADMKTTFEQLSQVGKVHVTELNALGVNDPDLIVNAFTNVIRAAVQSHKVDSISFWYGLRLVAPRGQENDQYFNPSVLFDTNYRPTNYYRKLIENLSASQ